MEARGRYARLCVQLDVNKPFITSVQIGEFEQSVSYEGIQRLCFSCGRLGHRKEACPYSIRPVSPPPEPPPSHDKEGERVEIPQEVRGTDTSGNYQTDNAPGQEDTYGPWMVVARRKNGSKLAKELDPTKNLVDPNPHVLLSQQKNPVAKLDQNRAGKRKAVVDQDLIGYVLRGNGFNVLAEPIKPASTDPRRSVAHGEELPSLSIPSISNPKPQTFEQGPSSSIRGKKGMARFRAPLTNSPSVAPFVQTNHTHTSPLFSPKDIDYPLNPPGSFQFSSPSSTLVGDQLRRVHHDVVSDQDYGGREGPNRHEISNGMGVDSSLEGTKQKNGFSPLDNLSVGVLARRTIPGGGEEINLAIHPDVEFQGDLLSTLSEDEEEDEDEIGVAANSTDAKGRVSPLEGVDGTDGMEFDGRGVASPTN